MYKKILKTIKKYNIIVIARHIGVDPDALCSQLALRDVIRLNYPEKKVLAIGTGSSKFVHIGKLDRNENVEDALLIVTDTPDKKRVDSVDFSKFSSVIKIDHHPFVESFGGIELIDEHACSACEIIMKFLRHTNLQINSEIAELLFMGLVSDSNRFLFDSCTSETFSLVSYYLDKYPFDISSVYQKLYLRPLSEVRLEGYISSNMVVTENGLGYIKIPDSVIQEYGVDSASAGNMINDFNFIKEVFVWATITEDIKNNQIRISIRSRGPIINHIAEKHHGGGHQFASGVRVGSFDDAMKVMNDLDQLLIQYQSEVETNDD
ncbi:MAG TPA: bifunctional oligoribonuclease/PAP phosphatase NrnA [Candidatus Faecimonas gallistercoris]|nr:bifunctional oligoribonuclease/PAP phosphatase NrnA [Candidatus Faecimonas gallistercoris]